MSLISVDNISAGYSKNNVIENISFEINEGELVGVLGVNGCGKSTLAKAVCNVIPHSGTVSIKNRVIEDLTISQIAKIISYIPQHSGLGIDISVLDVVMMGFNSRLKLFEKPNNSMKMEAEHIIDLLGLSNIKTSNYMLLSEGQKQLTILARALISNGTFIVMDEPETALDFNVRINFIEKIKDWISKGSRAGLIILHDVMLALNSCDKLILMGNKSIITTIDLHNDTVEIMEEKLKKVYGDISLLKVTDKKGKDNLVMLFESEDT